MVWSVGTTVIIMITITKDDVLGYQKLLFGAGLPTGEHSSVAVMVVNLVIPESYIL